MIFAHFGQSDPVIDIAPQADEEPGPIRLPTLTVTAPQKASSAETPGIQISSMGLTPFQIGGIIVAVTIAVGAVTYAIVASSAPRARRRRA